MKTLPTKSQGYLVVAAVRVLHHLEERAPTEKAVAELLKMPSEEVGHLARGLESIGVIRILKSAFDYRLELADPALLETLPGDDEGPAIKEEVDAFHERKKKQHESIDTLFGEDPSARAKKRMSKVEAELKKFRKSGKGAPPPWAQTESDDAQ